MTNQRKNKWILIALAFSLVLAIGLITIKYDRSRRALPVSVRTQPSLAQPLAAPHGYSTLSFSPKIPTISVPFTFITSLSTQDKKILTPYITFNALVGALPALPFDAVSDFLARYPDTPLAAALRKKWLFTLAQQGQWQAFLTYYAPSKENDMQCLLATAYQHTGQIDKSHAMADALWMVPYSQSPACDELFSFWMQTQPVPVEKIWQRFFLALNAHQLALCQYLMTLLPSEQQITANQWIAIDQKPDLILNTDLFPNHDDNQNPLLTYGLIAIAKQDPYEGANIWIILQANHHFSVIQTQAIIQTLAQAFMKKNAPQTMDWLQQVNPENLNPQFAEDRLIFALKTHHWQLFLTWFTALPPAFQQKPIWIYWEARALEITGNQAEATDLYQHLIDDFPYQYYGLMSAIRLKQAFHIENHPLPLSRKEIKAVRNDPGIQRATLLFKLNEPVLANAEWWFAIARMNTVQRYIAAKLALHAQHYTLAIKTTGYLPMIQDLNLSYPRPYQHAVNQTAKALSIEAAFIYAIMRQESLFNPEATSYVGAQGLMQLMPATANMLITEDKLPSNFIFKLTDPKINIQIGSLYLNRLLTRCQHNPALAAAAYNAGPGSVKKWLPAIGNMDLDLWIESIPYAQTRDYVKNVVTYLMVYRYLENTR